MNRNTILGWSGALAAALVVVGCGGSTTSQTSAAPQGGPAVAASSLPATTSASASSSAGAAVDACAVVTQQEASAAIGAQAGAPDTSPGCSYKGPAGETVSVLLLPGNKAALDQGRALQGNPGYQDVPGVGDSAFMGSGGGSGQFFCLKGSTVMTITLSLGRDGAVADALSTLGKTACGRL